MDFQSKKATVLILAVAALISSRVSFLFVNDPEGPNLLIVIVWAAVLYALSMLTYLLYPKAKSEVSHKRILFGVAIQIIVAGVAVLLFK